MELSKRLQAVADLVGTHGTVADVGTDHGYIPIYLIENSKCDRAIAMDVNKGPLLRAEEHILEAGLQDVIETRLSDGVQKLCIGECDCVVVAGMGGALTIKIMEEGAEIFQNLQEFILQPQSEIAKVRQYLYEHDYKVISEDMVLEDGKYYPMMKVINEKADAYNAVEYAFGKCLLNQKHPVLKLFLEKEAAGKEKIIEHLNQETGLHIEKRIEELTKELEEIKYALQRYYSCN